MSKKYNSAHTGSKKGSYLTNGGRRNNSYIGKPVFLKEACCNLDDPSSIKSSVINNRGMLHSKYKWLYSRPYPYNIVKSDISTSQSEYMLQKKSALKHNSNRAMTSYCNSSKNPTCGKVVEYKANSSLDSSEYINRLQQQCMKNSKPFPFALNNGPCSSSIKYTSAPKWYTEPCTSTS